jgi:hypothetical protein
MTSITDEMVAMLPFQFNKSPTGNIYKILDLFGAQLAKISNATGLISDFKDFSQATGATLDAIGNEYGVARPSTNDTFYRFIIKSHIEMSLRVGTINELIQVLADTSGLSLSSFDVQNGSEPLSVRVNNIPTALSPDENQRNIVISWIENALPAGVRLEAISFREASSSEIAIGAVIEQSQWFSSPVSTMNVPGVI